MTFIIESQFFLTQPQPKVTGGTFSWGKKPILSCWFVETASPSSLHTPFLSNQAKPIKWWCGGGKHQKAAAAAAARGGSLS